MKNKIKVNDTVEFKASSLGSGTIIKLPNEEMYGDKLYTVEFIWFKIQAGCWTSAVSFHEMSGTIFC